MLEFHIPTFVWAVINLLVLFLILKKILFKPVTELMEKREASIREGLEKAEAARAEAAELNARYLEQMKASSAVADKIISDAREKANKVYDEMMAGARRDVESMMAKARLDMERDRIQMVKDVRGQLASLALIAASKVMEANMDNDMNRKLVENFIDEEGAA